MDKTGFQNNSTNNSLLFIAIGCFIATLIIAGIFLLPKFQELQIAWEKKEEKKQEIQNRENYLLRLGQLKTELAKNKEELSKIDSALPDYPSLSSLFNYLQNVSSESGLIFQKIAPFTVIPFKGFPRIQETVFSIEVAGSYDSLKNFLSVFEKSSRLIEVENISFSKPEKEEESFTFNLKLKTYSH